MDRAPTVWPNLDCPARGQTGQGNLGLPSRKAHRFICKHCHKTFTATKGTPFYRLRTPAETVSLVPTLMAHGCPLQAIVVAFGFDERTGAAWFARAGRQAQAVQAQVVEQPRDWGHVQADEIHVKQQGKISWMALAMSVGTRLGVAGEVSEQRDLGLLRRLLGRVRRCAAIPAHRWTVDELLSFHVPPPRWAPPQRRGRPAHALQRLVQRWCT